MGVLSMCPLSVTGDLWSDGAKVSRASLVGLHPAVPKGPHLF